MAITQIIMEIALTLASVTFMVLVAFVIPVVCKSRRQLEDLVQSIERLEVKVEVLVDNSNDLVRNVNELSHQVNRQMAEVGEVVDTVHHWTSRANRVVEEVGSIVEPPVFVVARYANMLRRGASAFLQKIISRNRSNRNQ